MPKSPVRPDDEGQAGARGEAAKGEPRLYYLLFLVQIVICLWAPFYNRVEPSLAGIPFFYWFQTLCVVLGAAMTAIVYFATGRTKS